MKKFTTIGRRGIVVVPDGFLKQVFDLKTVHPSSYDIIGVREHGQNVAVSDGT